MDILEEFSKPATNESAYYELTHHWVSFKSTLTTVLTDVDNETAQRKVMFFNDCPVIETVTLIDEEWPYQMRILFTEMSPQQEGIFTLILNYFAERKVLNSKTLTQKELSIFTLSEAGSYEETTLGLNTAVYFQFWKNNSNDLIYNDHSYTESINAHMENSMKVIQYDEEELKRFL